MENLLPRYPEWFSRTFSGKTFFLVEPPAAANSDLVVLGPFWPISKCPRLKTAQTTTKSPFSTGGGPTEKKDVAEEVAEDHPG